MKYLYTYEAHKGGTASPSVDDLMKFHGHLMNSIKKSAELDKKWNFIGRRTPNNPRDPDSNIVKVDAAIKEFILTPKFRAAVITKYKTDIPSSKLHLQYRRIRKEEHRQYWVWGMYDNLLPKERKFELTIEVDTTIDEEYQNDNTVVSLMIWIKPNNNRKDYFEMYNRKIKPHDEEGNMYILLDMIKQFGEQMEKDFEIPVKLSKSKIIHGLDVRKQDPIKKPGEQ